ncbi:MAG TPA: c-type cytochrome [Acidisarcina sp.]
MSPLAIAIVVAGTLLPVGLRAGSAPPQSSTLLLRDRRGSASDLEISEAAGATRFVAYEDLLKLPLVTYTVSDDSNFGPETQVSGVPLGQLARAAGAKPDLVVAICNDKYRAHYTSEYIAAHRPLLVLKVNGRTAADWPKSHDGGSMGPYLISHPPFTPSFHILSHTDEPQIPYGVVRVEFRSQLQVLGAIRPPGAYPPQSAVWQGYRIAQQNCLRCHNLGAVGGQMARHPWTVLAAWAASDPEYFVHYVRNPRAAGAGRMMPAMTSYDDRTLEALRAYFATFAARPRP